jgi:hypothetical protein
MPAQRYPASQTLAKLSPEEQEVALLAAAGQTWHEAAVAVDLPEEQGQIRGPAGRRSVWSGISPNARCSRTGLSPRGDGGAVMIPVPALGWMRILLAFLSW